MCKKDRTLDENVEGAETLSYLIQEDPELQKITSICDHSMKALAEYLSYTDIQQLDSRQAQKKVQFWFQISYIAPTTEKGTVLVSHQLHCTRHRKIYCFGFTSATLHQAQKNVQFWFHISYISPGTEQFTVLVSCQLHCTRHRTMYSLGFMWAHRYPAAWLASGTEKGTVLVSHQPHRHPAAWLPTGIKKVLVQTSHSEIQLLDLLQTQQTMAYNRHSRLRSFGSHQLCRQYNLWQMQKAVQLWWTLSKTDIQQLDFRQIQKNGTVVVDFRLHWYSAAWLATNTENGTVVVDTFCFYLWMCISVLLMRSSKFFMLFLSSMSWQYLDMCRRWTGAMHWRWLHSRHLLPLEPMMRKSEKRLFPLTVSLSIFVFVHICFCLSLCASVALNCCHLLLSCPDYKIVVCMAQSSVALLKILICVPFFQLHVNN